MKINTYNNDDYAGIDVGDYEIYYGYEFGRTDDDVSNLETFVEQARHVDVELFVCKETT